MKFTQQIMFLGLLASLEVLYPLDTAGGMASAWAQSASGEDGNVENVVDEIVEGNLNDAVEDIVENTVNNNADGNVSSTAESAVEQNLEGTIDQATEPDINGAADAGNDNLDNANIDDDDVDNTVDERIDASFSSDDEGRNAHESGDTGTTSDPEHVGGTRGVFIKDGKIAGVSSAASGRVEETFIGIGTDQDGNEISLGEWLVIASPAEVSALESLGYVTRRREPLNGLDRVLALMEAPTSFNIEEAQAVIGRAVPGAEVDYNHVYRTEAGKQNRRSAARSPRALYPLEGADTALTLGVIDTAAEITHPTFRAAHVRERDFVPYAAERPRQHGTSILSILVGSASGYLGLLPQAEIFMASVFFVAPDGTSTATAVSLVRALDWMTSNHIKVVTMSLAGPKNDILDSAIDRAYAQGTVVVAAMGNRGPAAKPLFPAAHEPVIAVTAVADTGQIYRLANRGKHVDFSAPGVNVLHARIPEGYEMSSGTSLAAPFVAAVVALSCRTTQPLSACVNALERNAQDIGSAGFDPIYGHGFIRALKDF